MKTRTYNQADNDYQNKIAELLGSYRRTIKALKSGTATGIGGLIEERDFMETGMLRDLKKDE